MLRTTLTRGLLLAGMISLAGCGSAIPIQVSVDCAFAKRLEMSSETLAWLSREGSPPPYVLADLDRVAKHNDKVDAICR